VNSYLTKCNLLYSSIEHNRLDGAAIIQCELDIELVGEKCKLEYRV